jgi:uncharacterized delta-60 repeat protein
MAITISALAVQPDGKVLLVGDFIGVQGGSRNGVARLDADGTLDRTFDPGSGANGPVMSIAVQPDGRIVIGGSFSSFNSTPRNNIARLNADGSLDGSFGAGTGPDGVVRSIALQPDGGVIIGGGFTTVDGVVRPHVARLHGDTAARSIFLRSDCSDDGIVNISDAVCILNWLFRGGAAPVCLATADADGGGAVDIADPVYLLSHLFLGGPAPPDPYPTCGVPETALDPELGCDAPVGGCDQ